MHDVTVISATSEPVHRAQLAHQPELAPRRPEMVVERHQPHALSFATATVRDGGTNSFCRAGSRCATRVITSFGDRRRGLRPAAAMLDDHRNRIARLVHRRESDEERVIAELPRNRIRTAPAQLGGQPAHLRGAGLARHVEAFDVDARARAGAALVGHRVHAAMHDRDMRRIEPHVLGRRQHALDAAERADRHAASPPCRRSQAAPSSRTAAAASSAPRPARCRR